MPSVSPEEFRVALRELGDAITFVRGESAHISDLLVQIGATFEGAQDVWRSPSAATFEPVHRWFSASARDLHELLEDLVRRMDVAHHNYESAEFANYKNVGGK